jgi:L-asparaginase II
VQVDERRLPARYARRARVPRPVRDPAIEPIRVTVRRGGVVEAVHRVHVAATDGSSFGEPELTFFLRSSSKPIQAIPFVEGYDDLDDDEVAIACSSHHAEPAQLDAVRKVLARAGATVDDLENGLQECRPEGKLGHNCSGKHAGMLAACHAHGWPPHPYRDPSHPLQQRIAELLGGGETAIDGCGVPTFATTLRGAAELLTRTPERIRRAMRARPELVGASQGSTDTDLMRLRDGWIAKGGAEGLFCAAHEDGRGYAFKAEDGASRGIRAAVGQVLGIEEFLETPVGNSRGEVVGSIA